MVKYNKKRGLIMIWPFSKKSENVQNKEEITTRKAVSSGVGALKGGNQLGFLEEIIEELKKLPQEGIKQIHTMGHRLRQSGVIFVANLSDARDDYAQQHVSSISKPKSADPKGR